MTTKKYRAMYRARKPDGTYTEILELGAISAILGDVDVNEDVVLENWMTNFYDTEIWDNETATWREW